MENKHLLELVRNKNIKELEKILKTNKKIDVNYKEDDNDPLIFYVLLFNYENILDLILNRNVRLDLLDVDGKSILFNPIKHNYISSLKKILIYDSKHIGISILDIKDKYGLTSLHYSIIFNKFDIFKILLEYKANYLSVNNDNLNCFYLCIQMNRKDFFTYLLNLENVPSEINFNNNNKETLLHYAIKEERYDFIEHILSKKINVNGQESIAGLTALHMAIIKNNIKTIKQIIMNGVNININIQDYYGNSPLHYAISEKNDEIIKFIIKNNPNYNLINIDGDTALHNYLENNNMNKEILQILITNTNLNIQNNFGTTCLKMLLDLELFIDYKDILEKKELNFFIQDNDGQDLEYYLDEQNILKTVINSYYNEIINKNVVFTEKWEQWCKLKTLKINKNEPIEICKEKIKDVIKREKRSLPKLKNLNLHLDNGIFLNACFYTGIPLDILFGLIFLYETFKKSKFALILDYPLTVNTPLEKYYEKIGYDYPFKLEFSNCEILWSFQKIFYPSFFDFEFAKKIKDNNIKYIAIPLGIELSNGSHANILFVDKINMTIERFEPNGANYPIGLNYNPHLLDITLENKFIEYELKFIKPDDFLPTIGFQILENIEDNKCKKLGDPNGFCGVWCTWWVYHRLNNSNVKNTDLANLLIQDIKIKNISYKNLIRNFAFNIVELRDKKLKKYKIDINDWMVGNIELDTINQIEKEILNI